MRHALLVALFASTAVAQTIHRVGPTRPFATIQAAIDAAGDGDVILIDAGTYDRFRIESSLVLRADPPTANVVVTGASVIQRAEWNLPASKLAVVDGLHFATGAVVRAGSASGAGVLSVQRCTFTRGVEVSDAHVRFAGCSIGSLGSDGLSAAGAATISAVETSFAGGSASWLLILAGARLAGTARLHASHCTFQGGAGGSWGSAYGSGLKLEQQSLAWIADSSLSGFPTAAPAAPPGFAIDNRSTGPVAIARCSLSTGIPGSAAPTTFGTVVASPLLGARTQGPLQVGGALTLQYAAVPQTFVVSQASLVLAPSVLFPLLEQPEWGFVASSFSFDVQTVDPAGVATTTLTIPNLPSLQHQRIWFLAWNTATWPLQSSVILGGAID